MTRNAITRGRVSHFLICAAVCRNSPTEGLAFVFGLVAENTSEVIDGRTDGRTDVA